MKGLGNRGVIRFGCAAALAASVLAGCQSERPFLENSEVIGHSVEGRPIEKLVLGTGDEVTLILATIHGNENAGTPLVQKTADLLARRPELLKGRKVVLVPVVNPDGYSRHIRTNARGIDLNRNFASSNRQNTRRYGATELSEPEAKVIASLLDQYKPDKIVTIHQPLSKVDWDGPGEDLARHMGQYTDLPVERIGARPGSLGSFAGEDLKIPIITYELPKGATGRPTEELWEKYGPALVSAITYPEPLPVETLATGRGEAALAVALAVLLVAGILALMLWEMRRRPVLPGVRG